MNKQEAIQELDKLLTDIDDLGESYGNGFEYAIKLAKSIIYKIDEL